MNKLFYLLVALIFMLPAQSVNAQFWKKKQKKEVVADTVKKKKEKKDKYKEILKEEHETSKGLFTIYKFKKDNKILFEIPLSLKGRDFLLASTISATSDNGSGIVGQKPHKPVLFQFTFENNKVQMVLPNTRILESKDKNIQKALEKSNLMPVYESFKIKAHNTDSTAVLIDVTDFFVSSNSDINPLDPYGKNTHGGRAELTGSFKKNYSYLKSVKAFEDNVTIKSTLSYSTSVTAFIFTLMKNQPFIADVTRTIMILPEKPMRARYADSRMNVFFNYKKNYTSDAKGCHLKFFTNKWRLEPKNLEAWKRGELVEPIKPIVFYVDNNYPEDWKKYVFEGVEQWQEAFEEIGFKNAIIAKPFPTKEEDPNFDPDNLKYSCLRYAPVDMANSMGPSWIDPRSGEIINASVYSYHDVVKLLRNWRFVQTAQCDKRMRKMKFDKELMGEALRYVITHEIGHCLGFMHNMSASAAIPTDSLRSAKFTQKYGTTYSVMDYARNNYVAQPGDLERGVKLTPPRLGLYDFYSVKWLYSPIPNAKTSEDEISTLDRWISEKEGNLIYRYGKQQLGVNYDPSSLTEDIGSDVIKSSNYGIKNLKFIMKNFNEWVKEEDKDFSFRNEIYGELVNQYKRYIGHLLSNIGGIYINETVEGGALNRYETVSKAKQKKVLKFLFKEISDNNWLNDKSINEFIDFKLPVISELNNKIYSQLLSKSLNVKFANTKVSNNKDKYSEKEYLNDMYRLTWGSLLYGKKLTGNIKGYQDVFIDYLLQKSKVVKAPASPLMLRRLTDESIWIENSLEKDFDTNWFNFVRPLKLNKMDIDPSLYYAYLLKTKAMLQKNSNKGNIYERAHYQMLLRKIERAMEK